MAYGRAESGGSEQRGGSLPEAVGRALAQAAAEQGVPLTAVTLVSFEAVEWPNAALGAPRPGRAYAQMVTPGYRVTLAIAGRTLVYHTDRGRRVVRGPDPA